MNRLQSLLFLKSMLKRGKLRRRKVAKRKLQKGESISAVHSFKIDKVSRNNKTKSLQYLKSDKQVTKSPKYVVCNPTNGKGKASKTLKNITKPDKCGIILPSCPENKSQQRNDDVMEIKSEGISRPKETEPNEVILMETPPSNKQDIPVSGLSLPNLYQPLRNLKIISMAEKKAATVGNIHVKYKNARRKIKRKIKKATDPERKRILMKRLGDLKNPFQEFNAESVQNKLPQNKQIPDLASSAPVSTSNDTVGTQQMNFNGMSFANAYGSNVYNPNPERSTGLRPIVIDGNNVAMGHGNNTHFSSRGLKICIDFFVKKGHKVAAFVPKYRRSCNKTKDSHLLDELQREGYISFTPSRRINGRRMVSYDDRYIVQYAAGCGGIIISQDNYCDLTRENPVWKETVQNRLLMYTWVGDVLMFPEDPLGKYGPTLEEFLKFP